MNTREEHLTCGRAYTGQGPADADVKGVLLGRKSQYAPDRAFDTLHIRLEVDVDIRGRSLKGDCRTRVRAFRDGVRELAFDAEEMKILGASWQGKACKTDYDGKKLKVKLPRALQAHDEGEVSIRYRLKDPRAGIHFIPAARRNGPQVWTQGQPEDSRFWFPCHDAPQEKATTEVIATVPAGFAAVSNGTMVSRTVKGGRPTYHWSLNRPHSVYLVCLSVGKFVEVKDRWEEVSVEYWVEKGREADARRGFGKTPAMLDFFSKMIGVRYQYPRYAQVAVANFPGGMENTTCTTQTDAALMDARAALDTDFDGLVAHELAHQWFGDLLTCKDWSHAWLNEGFATYFEILFTEHDKGLDEALYELYNYGRSYFQEDRERYRRPIVSDRFKYPWVLFDRHLYEKGASVLHLIRFHLRDKDWWRAIRHYVSKHRDSSVETSDLITAIREATGRNLQSFFDQWVFRAGYPRFQLRYRWDAEKGQAVVRLRQTQPISDDAPAFSLPVEFWFEGRVFKKTFNEKITGKEHTFRFKLPAEPLQADFDPHRWILKQVEFQKPLSLWLRQLTHGINAVARIEAAHALARWGSAESVEALVGAFRKEKFWGARAEIASALGDIRGEAGVRALKGLLATPHPKVRRAVVAALGKSKRAEVSGWLKPFLRDKSVHVSAEAARSLGQHRDPSLLPVLLKASKQDSWWDVVQAGAVSGIAATRDKAAVGILRSFLARRPGYAARVTAIRGLGSLHGREPGIVNDLLPLIEEKDERIVLAAVGALGTTGDERAVAPIEKLRDTHPNQRIKTYCDEALVSLKGGSDDDSKKKKAELSRLRSENSRLKAALAN